MNAVRIAAALHGRKNSTGWIARCPAHDDHGPSLSITEGRDAPGEQFASDVQDIPHRLAPPAAVRLVWLPSLLAFIEKHIDTARAEGGVR